MGTVSRVHTFASGAILTAAQLNNEFDNLLTSSAINGGLDATNLGVTAGQATASKALVVDASRNLADATGSNRINNLALSGTFESTGAVTASAGITSGGNIVSDTDSTDDLGTTGVRWANLFVDDVTVTNNVTIGGTLTLTGGITLNGNTTIGDSSADTLTVNSTITSNLIFTDATYDIGASGATRPRDLHLSRNALMGGTLGVTGLITATGGVSGNLSGNVTGGTISGSTGLYTSTLATSAGDIGVGTHTPSGLGTRTLNIKAGSSAGADLTIEADNGTNFGVFYSGQTTNDPFSIFSNTGFKFATASDKNATGFDEHMRITSDGNTGLGVTPSAWLSTVKALQIGDGASVYNAGGAGGDAYYNNNWYINSSSQNIYLNNGYALSYGQAGGEHRWYTAASGTAGNTVSFTQAMTLTNAGNLGLGTSSPTTFAGYTTLHHKNSSGDVVQLAENDNGVIHQIIASGTDTVLIGSRSNHDLKIGTNDTTAVTVDTSQRVGIGTGSPLSGLHISDGVAYGSPQNASRKATLTISAGTEASADLQFLNANYNHIFFGDSADANVGTLLYDHTNNSMQFAVNGTERLRITSDGDLLIGETTNQIARVYSKTSTSGDYAYMGVTTHADRGPAFFSNTNGSFNDQVLVLRATRAATTAYDFARFNSSAGADIEFRFAGDGNAYADGAWNGSGADYQEYFESQSGSAAEVGRAIVLDGDKVRYYNADTDSTDAIMGVTRPEADNKNSAVVGNVAWNHWTDKYLTDDWGVYLREDVTVWTYTDDEGNEFAVYERDELAKDPNWTPPEGAASSTQSVRKLNPDYDESLDNTYQSREARDEWWLVGLLGQIQVKAGEPVNPRWIKMKNISDAVELYYVR